MAKKDVRKPVITPEFRVAFPFVFQPRTKDAEGKPVAVPKYEVTMLFPKNADLKALAAEVTAAIIERWGPDRTKWPAILDLPFKDGDLKKDVKGFAGHYKVSAKTKFKPGVVDRDKQDIIDPSQFYAGCYARASVNAFGWKHMNKEGVSFNFNNVQFLRDGEPLGGGTSPDQDFDALPPMEGTALQAAPAAMPGLPGAAPQAAPAQPQQPVAQPQQAAPTGPQNPLAGMPGL